MRSMASVVRGDDHVSRLPHPVGVFSVGETPRDDCQHGLDLVEELMWLLAQVIALNSNSIITGR